MGEINDKESVGLEEEIEVVELEPRLENVLLPELEPNLRGRGFVEHLAIEG